MTEINGIELMPCPHPHSRGAVDNIDFVVDVFARKQFQMVCLNCESRGPRGETLNDAIEAWNKRAEPEDECPMAKPKRTWIATGKATLVDDLAASVADFQPETDYE